jgi:ABC-2 type transport system permease protein
MPLAHTLRALRAVTMRELLKFVQQRGRLLSALVRPLIWLAVFAAGFYNVFGVSIIPPYKTYVTYQVYIVPGLLGMILLFHGMQSSLSMVYDREMGVMRLLLTAPLPRWLLLACKLAAGTALAVVTCYVFLAVCILFDVTFEPMAWLTVLPALIVSGLMLGSLWLFLSVHIKQLENFAGAMNFVMFPMFFFSSALYPLWKLREGGSEGNELMRQIAAHAKKIREKIAWNKSEFQGMNFINALMAGAALPHEQRPQTPADMGGTGLNRIGF